MTMDRRCAHCRTPLKGGRADRRYCDELCRQLARDRREPGRGSDNNGACLHCGESIAEMRADAMYCSGRCRTAAHRAGQSRYTPGGDEGRLRRRRA